MLVYMYVSVHVCIHLYFCVTLNLFLVCFCWLFFRTSSSISNSLSRDKEAADILQTDPVADSGGSAINLRGLSEITGPPGQAGETWFPQTEC